MNTAGNAYAATPFDGSVRHNRHETNGGATRIGRNPRRAPDARMHGKGLEMRAKNPGEGAPRGRTHSRGVSRKRTWATSRAGVVFRPRPSCRCANPALSTYGYRPSILSSAARMAMGAARIAAALVVIAALVLATRAITQSVTQAAAVGQAEESVSLDIREATDPLEEDERQELIGMLVADPVDYASEISAVLQGEEYPSGCEPAALASVLQSMGMSVPLEDVIEYLNIDSDFIDFVYHYAGDPAGDGSAWPQAMVDTANRYLTDAGYGSDEIELEVASASSAETSSGTASETAINTASENASDGTSEASSQPASFVALNISGASFDELRSIMAAGYPVMAWTTTYMEEPEFSDYEIFGYQFVVNNHCVVAYGMSNDGENVLVMDSLEGLVERDADDFTTIYEERGCLAMIIAPAKTSA